MSTKNSKFSSLSSPKLHYPLVVISDTHLGKKHSQADMLFEFLHHTDCDTLILNGDIVDGWKLVKDKQKPFPEMHRRVIDAINAKIEQGTKVIYIAGNHDMTLRGTKIMNKTAPFRGFYFEEALNYKDPHGRQWFMCHGDQYDGKMLHSKGGVLYKIGDTIYDGLVAASVKTSKVTDKLLKKRFSAAAYLKRKTKNVIQIIGDFENAVMESAIKNNADGIICGHIHTAEWREVDMKDKKKHSKTVYYGNSGDWVESCTALTQDEKGDWAVMHWLDKRGELGLKDLPKELDTNPYAAQRVKTNKLLLWVNRLWPGHNRDKKMEEFLDNKKQITTLSKQPELLAEKKATLEKLETRQQKLRPKLWPGKVG